jgi:hypothetical protein
VEVQEVAPDASSAAEVEAEAAGYADAAEADGGTIDDIGWASDYNVQ